MVFWSKNKNPWLKNYNATRYIRDKSLICRAPFNSMYFNVHGEAGPCWLNLSDMGKYPENSVREIWFGKAFSGLRQAVKDENLDYRCGTCAENIRCGNHVSVLAKLYDYPYSLKKYPTVMEFELSNRCNLECVMCKGELSSTIRKNRENLPPLRSPYDEEFVRQLEEFIPHLEEAKFLGGEPFLIDIYYQIWELIARVKPTIKITITTNATVFNNRVKGLLERLNCNIIVSLDSFEKETYESIRVRGNFDHVISNVISYRDYTVRKDSYMQVSFNPLRKNWRELASSVEFANSNGITIWFNTVIYPHEQALWTFGAEKLREIYDFLSKNQIEPKPKNCPESVYRDNLRNYNNLVENQIKNWLTKAKEKETGYVEETKELSGSELVGRLRKRIISHIDEDAYLTESLRLKKRNEFEKQMVHLSEGRLEEIYVLSNSDALKAVCEDKQSI